MEPQRVSSQIYYIYSDVGVVSQEWQHIVVTYDQQNVKIYRNTLLLSNNSENGTINSTTNPLLIGSLLGAGDSSYQYSGYMDEVMLFNNSLSQTEITELYNNSLNPASVPEPTSIILVGVGSFSVNN